MGIIFDNQTESTFPDACGDLLQQIFDCTLEREQIPKDAEVGLTFVDDESIRQLNAEHRNIDQATDVLSFPLYDVEEDFDDGTDAPVLLGDVVISIPHTLAQAEAYGHSPERELGYLFVHGLLHLAGYDHMNDEDKDTMRGAEEAILYQLGVVRYE